MRGTTKVLATAAGTAAALEAARRVVRTPVLTWGATDEEVARKLPGDELLPHTAVVSTRAITIDAPPSAVWPWLVQMGAGRGGAYTYDWIENLFGLEIHGTWVWAFVLDDLGGATRLLSRNRIAMVDPSLGDRIGMAVMEPGSLVMERKMLHGVERRAERLAATQGASPAPAN